MIRTLGPTVPWFGIAILAFVAGPSAARAQFEGQYLGSVTITNGTTPSPPAGATAEIVPRAQFPESYLVTLRDGTFNPSMVAFYDGVLLRGGDTLSNGVQRTLTAGYRADGRTLFITICLGPDRTLHQCDIRTFVFEGLPAPSGACVLPEDGRCVFTQAFVCALNGGQYVGDSVLCLNAGACTLNGICSIKTAAGCAAVGGTFDGAGTRCPLPGDTIHWINTQGGDYAVADNWDPARVPVHDTQRSDAAVFISVSTVLAIPIAGPQATAGRWEIVDSAIAFAGDAILSSSSALPPSLALGFGSLLEYESGFLTTHHSVIGSGSPLSRMTMKANTSWFNLGSLKLGTNAGPGRIELGELSFLNVSAGGIVGSGSDGELRVAAGAVAQIQNGLSIGSVFGGSGSVTVSGSVPTRRSRLSVSGYTGVGDPLGSSPGFLTVSDGGEIEFTGTLGINHRVAGENAAAVTVEGFLPTATLNVHGTILVGELGPGDMIVSGAGTVDCENLRLGSLIPGSDGELRLEGLGSGILVSQQAMVGGSGGHGDIVVGQGTFLNVTGTVRVGDTAGGSMSVASGAQATVGNGLFIGGINSGVGSVSISGTNATLEVTGSTEVGSGSVGSRGFLSVRADGSATLDENLYIDSSAPAANEAAVTVFSGGILDVTGSIVIGVTQQGDMIIGASAVECDQLVVGSDGAGASGFLIMEPQSLMYVTDAQVGGSGGYGIIRIDAGSTLEVAGNVRVGSSQGGLVTVNGQITGQGVVSAEPGGIIDGTGRISASKVRNGGVIAPGLSPGTLTIEGDYEQLPGGRLEIEYSGLESGAFDVLHVTGQVTLGGRLEVQFVDGFSPSDPGAFVHSQEFIESTGGVGGEYDERVFVYPDVFADFDDDGDKDLLDFAALQNCFGSLADLGDACELADWESDVNVRGREIREFTARMSGPTD